MDEGKGEAEAEAERAGEDAARDSLHILPLATVPLRTPGLRRARLIKNTRLRAVVELFQPAAR